MKDILNWWTFTPTVILKRWYICWWIRHLMTLFLHTKDFYYHKKMKTCFLTRTGGRMCVQSEKQRLEKSPATCLRPSLPGLYSELCLVPSCVPRRALGGKESHDPLWRAWQFLSCLSQCHGDTMPSNTFPWFHFISLWSPYFHQTEICRNLDGIVWIKT